MLDPHAAPPIDMRPAAVRARIVAGDAASAWSRWQTGHGSYPTRAAALLQRIATRVRRPGRIAWVGMAYGWTMSVRPDGTWHLVMV